jgi:hypothetical protein
MATFYEKIKTTIQVEIDVESKIWTHIPDGFHPASDNEFRVISWKVLNEENIEDQIVSSFVNKNYETIKDEKCI